MKKGVKKIYLKKFTFLQFMIFFTLNTKWTGNINYFCRDKSIFKDGYET